MFIFSWRFIYMLSSLPLAGTEITLVFTEYRRICLGGQIVGKLNKCVCAQHCSSCNMMFCWIHVHIFRCQLHIFLMFERYFLKSDFHVHKLHEYHCTQVDWKVTVTPLKPMVLVCKCSVGGCLVQIIVTNVQN